MAVQLIRKVRDRQPTKIVGLDPSHPLRKRIVDAWLPNSMAQRSVLGRSPVATGPIGLAAGKFGIGAFGISKAVQYDVGEWSESGPHCFVAVCSFFSYGPTSSVVRKDGASTPVQVANSTVRAVAWNALASCDYYPTASGVKHSVLVTNRESVSTVKLYVDGYLVLTNSGLSSYGSTTNKLCFLGTETDGEIFNSSAGLFFGGFAVEGALTEPEIGSISKNPWQIFAPETIPLFFSTVTAQYARPTSDVSSGTWTASSGSDLFAMLDETVANDADYITATSASTCEVALGSLSDPASSVGHIVRYRISSTGGGITVRLRQGTTTIASWTHSPAPTSLTTYEQTLSGAEADSITDYSALKLQFEAY